MACRTAALIAIVAAIVAGGAAGCRRAPLADRAPGDGGADRAVDGPAAGDHEGELVDGPPREAARDTVPEVPPADAAIGDADDDADGPSSPPDVADARDAVAETIDDAPADLASDAPADVAADAPSDTPAPDAPIDMAPPDAPEDRGGPDRSGSDARPEDEPCGPSGFHCNPFACDVARGICKTTCAGDDDCYARRPCIEGRCVTQPEIPCAANEECLSGFCAQGACCASACTQTCFSCAVLGTIGTCSFVPNGMPSPNGGCSSGRVCDGRGQCVPPSCTAATDCGRSHSCSNGRCLPCVATCASSADCAFGATCVDNNGCTYCGFPDAGAD